jgi:PIN domain nuclease of toxin-antitoxin system
MFGDPKLGRQAREAIHSACIEEQTVVSAITPWEIGVLVSTKRVELYRDVLEWVRDALALPGVRLWPLTVEIAVGSTRLPWEMHPDPADRILVATARSLGATLVTADGVLLEFSEKGYFKTLDARI